jgi:hypothetical protein
MGFLGSQLTGADYAGTKPLREVVQMFGRRSRAFDCSSVIRAAANCLNAKIEDYDSFVGTSK